MRRNHRFGSYTLLVSIWMMLGAFNIVGGRHSAYADAPYAFKKGSGVSQASPPTGVPQATDCGQACSYQKANDNVTLQTVYVLRKLDRLKSLLAADDNSEEVKTNLGEFCQAGESAKACFERYKTVQLGALQKMRGSIGANEDMIGKLNSKRGDGQGPLRQEALAIATDDVQTGQVPEVPTLKDIDGQIKAKPGLTKVGQSDYAKWLQHAGEPPKKEDFLKFVEVDREPGNPAAGKLSMVQKDGNGNPATDDEAYKNALKSWNDRKKLDGTKDEDFKKIVTDLSQKKDPLNAVGMDPAQSKASQEEYIGARYEIVSGANRVISGSSVGNSKDLNFNPKQSGMATAGSAPAIKQVQTIDPDEQIKPQGAEKRDIHVRYQVDDIQKDIEEASKP